MRTLLLYAQAIILCLIIVFVALGLGKADFRVPFHYTSGGDAFFFLGTYKSIADTGWYTENPWMSAPGTMEIYDFPIAETGLFLGIKLLTALVGDPFLAANLFYLGTFLLATWTSLYVFRELELDGQLAVAASLLFTFSTYHFWRGPHHPQFAAYYAIPLIALSCLRISSGESIFFPAGAESSSGIRFRPGKNALEAMIASLLISLSGVYFAYFAAALLAAAGLIASLRRLRWVSLLDAALLIVVIIGTFAVQLAPFLVHAWRYGYNPELTRRDPSDYYAFGLSLNNLLMPSAWHRLSILGRWSLGYADKTGGFVSFFRQNEGIGSSPLGLVASAGLLTLLAAGVTSPAWLEARIPRLANLARLTLATVLFSILGGVSEIVVLHLTSMFRSYNRISIFLFFFGLLAVGLLVRLLRRDRSGLFSWVLLATVTALALLDQMPTGIAPDHARDSAAFRSDRQFVRRIERSVPAGSAIFQLPAVWFPAFGELYQMDDHDHLRGYLHSHQVRWSYGAVPGRTTYRWQEAVAALPVPELIRKLTDSGFSGIYLNTKGYRDGGRRLVSELRHSLGKESAVGGSDGSLLFFRLPEPGAKPGSAGFDGLKRLRERSESGSKRELIAQVD